MDTVSIDSRSLYSRLGRADAPLVLDVRRDDAFGADDVMLAGALRPQGDLAAFAATLPRGRKLVAYCVKGAEVGQEAAAALASAGFECSYLQGGLNAWREGHLPTMRKRPDWRVPGASRWITRERPKIDRIACPWLIRRFVDPLATFDYVPTARVFAEAEARGAIPYDIPGAVVSHRGERCSFDALIEDFGLDDAALAMLATIVRGADTDRLDLATQSAGLLAASLGLSQRFADDHEMLENAMALYDGLYAWCRAELEGSNERHRWNPPA
ncbi:MAG TPA: chromate resistance protein ChrB domain-containing protein [Usitatibacter sp.]|nr:chromate resistance protein ChrB domain-containing protein [Usitatibacter sp.]